MILQYSSNGVIVHSRNDVGVMAEFSGLEDDDAIRSALAAEHADIWHGYA